MEPQHGLQQQRVTDLAHALDRCAVSTALQAGDLDLQTEQAQTLCPFLDPFLAAVHVLLNTTQQFLGDAGQLHVIDLIGKVGEPAGILLALLGLLNRFPIE